MIGNFTEQIVAAPLSLALDWKNGKLTEIHLGWAEGVEESAQLSKHAAAVKEALLHYVSGEDPIWPDLPYDFSQLTDFHRKALDALRTIPRGTITTYGSLAMQVGSPQGAQAIGKAMGTNPFPLLYPCHRVVGKGGAMVGFSASGGVELKEFLLELEGASKKRKVAVQADLFG